MLEAARAADGPGEPVHLFGELADGLFGALPAQSRLSVGATSGAAVTLLLGAFGLVLLVQVL